MRVKSNRLTFEWMAKDTVQGAWIEGKGVLLWLAFFFTEIGAGIYLVSLFMNFRPGWVLGWVTVLVLGGFFHILFLGKPARGWRMLNGFARSELSRGLLIILLFAMLGFFQVLPVLFPAVPWGGSAPFLNFLMGALCILSISHGFLTMGVVRALPMWNSPMMIPFGLISGIWVGSQAVEVMLFLRGWDITAAEIWARWSLLCFICIAAVFFWWGGAHSSETARASIKRILKGDLAPYFYILVLTVGIIVPLIISILIWIKGVANSSGSMLFLRLVCVFLGDLMMRYCIMRGCLYARLI